MTVDVIITNKKLNKAIKIAKPILVKSFKRALIATAASLLVPELAFAGQFANTLLSFPYNVATGIAVAGIASAIIAPFLRALGKGNFAQLADTVFYVSAVAGVVTVIVYVANKVFGGLMSL